MTWEEWKKKYHKELDHPAGYEEQFVTVVLSKIPEISPSDVIPQYHFTDSKGKSRYIDFMIRNNEKNWLLPIELDGYAKMIGNGNEYYRFNDFLERQNSLIGQFNLVLRYSNYKMLTYPNDIISEIKNVLELQQKRKNIKSLDGNKLMDEYKKILGEIIKELQKTGEKIQKSDILVQELNSEIESLKKMVKGNAIIKNRIGCIIVLIIPILFVAYTLYSSRNNSKNHIKNDKYVEGKLTSVCGFVSEAKTFKSGTYLNLNGKFPNQEITLVVWEHKYLDDYVGESVCTYGKIESYKGRLSVSVDDLSDITIK